MEPHVRCRQCRKLRTGNHVLAAYHSLRQALPASARPLESRGRKGSVAEDCEPFRRDWSSIGATTQRHCKQSPLKTGASATSNKNALTTARPGLVEAPGTQTGLIRTPPTLAKQP